MKFSVFCPANYPAKYFLFLFVFSFFSLSVWANKDTGSFAPLKKAEVESRIVRIEKAGVAGVFPEDPHFISVKRVNPSPSAHGADSVHLAKKDSISRAVALRAGRRDNALLDSVRVDTEYESNPFAASTPMDNHVAVSNDGIVVSVINTNILITDSLGDRLLFRTMNAAFFGDGALTSIIYDPRVVYDPDNDRFILVILHGSTSATTRVLVCFSKSNRPDLDGWNYYKFSGNPFMNSLWFDYPNIGINSKDLFVTGNLFTDAREYANKVIFQIDKHQGYAGETNIGSRVWGAAGGGGMLRNADNNLPFSMVPAYNGFAGDESEDMWFVNTNSGSGTKIYLYRITAALGNNPAIELGSVPVPMYMQERLSSQFSGNSAVGASPIRLISGDSRMKNAYIQNGIIHCVWNARPPQTQFSTINYARIDTRNNVVLTSTFAETGTDYAFAAVAPFSNNIANPTTLIVYTSSSAVKFPDLGVVFCDKDMNFSTPLTVKEGESFVNVFSSNSETRWGDYSGIAKRHNGSRPEVWISGSYGGITTGSSIPRHWKNWNAKIVSVDESVQVIGETRLFPNPVEPLESTTFNFLAEKTGEYTVRVYDMTGKMVKELYKDTLLAGEHRVTFSTKGYAIGTYVVRYYLEGKPLGFEKMLVITN